MSPPRALKNGAAPEAPRPREVEDESADPVGDGFSDAELARRLSEAPAPPPEPDRDAQTADKTNEKTAKKTDEKKGRWPAL